MQPPAALTRVFPHFTDLLRSDFRSAFSVAGKLFRLPLHKRKAQYLAAAGVLTGVVLTSAFDRIVNTRAVKYTGPWAKRASRVGHLYQTPMVILGTASGLYAYGVSQNNVHARRIGIEIVEAYAAGFVGTELLKHLLGRSRPFLNEGPYHFGGLRLRYRNTSFPSGDVAAAFSLSSVLAAETKSVSVALMFYSLASLTAFQRISTNQHWFSDTVASAVWGTAAGLAVVHLNEAIKNA